MTTPTLYLEPPADQPAPPAWDLRIPPATGRVSKWACSLFPPSTPKHSEVPHALMPVFTNNVSRAHANWGNQFMARFNVSYMVSAVEVCPTTDRLHYQFYFESNTVNLQVATVRRWINEYYGGEVPSLSMQRAVADANANTLYIQNPEKHMYGIYGEACVAGEPYVPQVGSGNTAGLGELIEGLRQGRIHLTDAALEYPHVYTRHSRVMQLAEAQYIRRLARSTMCSVMYLWGATGLGKSHYCFNNFGPAGGYYANPHLFYIYNSEDGKWWDDYTGQEYVIFNEYRGSLPLSFFLQLLDKWPVNVPRRNQAPYPFLAKYILITSAVPPRELYQNAFSDNDRLEQLTRRIGAGEVNVLSRLHMQSLPHFPDTDLADNQP